MGSFNSAPKINNPDCQDDAVLQIPNGLSIPDFIYHCKMMRGENRPQLLTRSFLKSPSVPNLTNDVTDGLRVLNLDTVSQTCSAPRSSSDIRLLQWNILSQCKSFISNCGIFQLTTLFPSSSGPIQRRVCELSRRSSHVGVQKVSDPARDNSHESGCHLPARSRSLQIPPNDA